MCMRASPTSAPFGPNSQYCSRALCDPHAEDKSWPWCWSHTPGQRHRHGHVTTPLVWGHGQVAARPQEPGFTLLHRNSQDDRLEGEVESWGSDAPATDLFVQMLSAWRTLHCPRSTGPPAALLMCTFTHVHTLTYTLQSNTCTHLCKYLGVITLTYAHLRYTNIFARCVST